MVRIGKRLLNWHSSRVLSAVELVMKVLLGEGSEIVIARFGGSHYAAAYS